MILVSQVVLGEELVLIWNDEVGQPLGAYKDNETCSVFHNVILAEPITCAQHSQFWKAPDSSLLVKSY